MNSMENLIRNPFGPENKLNEHIKIAGILFDESMIGCIIVRPDGVIQSINQAGAAILGYESPAYLQGVGLHEIDAGNTRQWFISQVEAFESGKILSTCNTSRYVKQDGTMTWVEFKLTFVPGDDNKIRNIICFFQDCSREKAIEEKLADTKRWLEAEVGLKTLELYEKNQELDLTLKKLESLDKAKNEFLRIISHEIRTPLNGILGATMMLRDLANTPEQKEFFELLDVSIRRLEGFALTAMQIAELQTRSRQLPRRPVSIIEILNEIGDSIDFDQHRRVWKTEIAAGLDPLMVNKTLFITALTKILENSIRFSPVDGVILLKVTPEADGLHFVITDNGPGFPEEVILHKFEPFVSGDTHVDQNPAMSLSLVKFIIEAHGGKIDIYNRISGGAVVDFFIPDR